MRKIIILSIGALFCFFEALQAQDFDHTYKQLVSDDPLKDKLFYLFTAIEELGLEGSFSDGPYLPVSLRKKQSLDSLAENGDLLKNIADIKFSEEEITTLTQAMGATARSNRKFANLVAQHLVPSGLYVTGNEKRADEVLSIALESALRGVNGILDSYGLGIHGKYAYIDSLEYDISDTTYISMVKNVASKIRSSKLESGSFYSAPVNLAISLLKLNERGDAARFEPMRKGVNKASVNAVSSVDFSRYQYLVILVPGNGPKGSERLSENAKTRLKSAVANYRRKLAPFIMVSGGNVHPFKTRINEAEEMKRELMEKHGIPESAILMEPHARHTTTNLRNCNRLVLRYGFPRGKKILITTDKKQADKIANRTFVDRSQSELKHIPFVRLARISDIDIEYYPVVHSLVIDLEDSLDP